MHLSESYNNKPLLHLPLIIHNTTGGPGCRPKPTSVLWRTEEILTHFLTLPTHWSRPFLIGCRTSKGTGAALLHRLHDVRTTTLCLRKRPFSKKTGDGTSYQRRRAANGRKRGQRGSGNRSVREIWNEEGRATL